MSSSINPSEELGIEFDVEVPSEEMEEKFRKWGDIYTVDKLSQMDPKGIESERIAFEEEVREFKTKHRRGRLVNRLMAKVAGKKPYSREQLQEARRLIEEEADRIRPRFKRAKGIKQEEKNERRREYRSELFGSLTKLVGNLSDLLGKLISP